MKKITLEEFLQNMDFYISEAKTGKIFIYPTDTIYGIGWIFRDDVVNKIYEIKNRPPQKLFPIIMPSFQYMIDFYQTNKIEEELKNYLNQYHGVMYIFDYNKPWARIIKHPFQAFVTELWVPFITTSCNISGQAPIAEITKLPTEISDQADYVIDGGVLAGKPSVLIDLVENKVIER